MLGPVQGMGRDERDPGPALWEHAHLTAGLRARETGVGGREQEQASPPRAHI